MNQGREELNHNYQDNFWDILPIERMQIDEQITLPDSIKNQNFGIAEEKAVKAIQRHSMLIEDKERNPKIDDAYLLLGKARYFDQRFIPALEAFNYVLHKYPASENINHAQVWREKTNLRLGNDKLAIKNLKKIIGAERLEDQDLADAHATLAQAYINMGAQDSALVAIDIAAKKTEKNEEKGRYFYIKGQLYNYLNEPDKANQAFDEVIELNRKSPRIYTINAHVEKAGNFVFSGNNHHELRELLYDLEADRENRPYLDKIYFQIAEYYNRLDSINLAIEYYNNSLRSPVSDKYLNSINYEILANIFFDRNNFQVASKYFDSTLANMSTRVNEYRAIKRKRDNLDDVILYEGIAEETDSILHLAQLTEAGQIDFFTAYTEKLKDAATAEAVAGNTALNTTQPVDAASTNPPDVSANSFYFYNPSRTSGGLRDFVQTWGNRELTDNWRWESSSRGRSSTGTSEEAVSINFENDPRFDPMTYVNQIPQKRSILDSLTRERNLAYYQLGMIYKEKFNEYELASAKLESLLANSPEERLILPAKYNLYKIYEITNQPARQELIKRDILENYPDSRYAAFIKNPESLISDESGPGRDYKRVYENFKNQEYESVIEKSNEYISLYSGDEIVPKFELLKAQAIGRIFGYDAFKEALNYLALNYPQTNEGKKAQDIINRAVPQLQNKEFNRDSTQNNFKLIYRFERKETKKALALKEEIDTALKDLNYDTIFTSVDIYDFNEVFVVVHGLPNHFNALGFAELLSTNKEYKISYEAIPISSENYKIVQIHKNLDVYLQTPN